MHRLPTGLRTILGHRVSLMPVVPAAVVVHATCRGVDTAIERFFGGLNDSNTPVRKRIPSCVLQVRRQPTFCLHGTRIDAVVLVMANPRCALHEAQVLLQVRTPRCGEQPGKVRGIKDHQRDADALGPGRHIELVQVLRQRGKVDAELAEPGVGIELDVVAEARGGGCGQRHRHALPIADGHEEVDRQAVLVGASG